MHYDRTVVSPYGVPLGGSGGHWRRRQGAELVTMMQVGDGAHLKGFIAGPFDVKAGQSTYQVNKPVAPLKDSMLLGMDFLRDHKLHVDAGSLFLFF